MGVFIKLSTHVNDYSDYLADYNVFLTVHSVNEK